MKILNYAVTECLEPGEIYLEIGTYAGRSVIPALKGNKARAYVIDNFWDSKQLKPTFQRNIERFRVADRIDLYDGDAEDFNQPLPGTVGVYLYDANHDRGFSHFNLEKFKPYFSKRAIIIVDDIMISAGQNHKCKAGYRVISSTPVADDVDQWIKDNPDTIRPLCVTPWTYGQAIMLYEDNN
jgi:predicted O-methyltransferase YrrM